MVPLVGEEVDVLLFHTGDDALDELLLSGLEEGRVVVEVSLHGLFSTYVVAVG